MDQNEALTLVRRYKDAIASDFDAYKVYLYGSYSKGTAHIGSDIDVAVVVPKVNGDWLTVSACLWSKVWDISVDIEPVLIEECHPSPLYEDVLQTGIAV